MTNSTTLELILTAKDEASAKVAGLGKSLESIQPTLNKVGVAAGVAFGVISTVAVSSLNAFSDAEAQTVVSTKSLENTLNSLTAKQLASSTGMKKSADALSGVLLPAMEKVSKAAVQLGFDDEDAASSFAKLFAVTKDTAQAQKEQALAMDLARYKGISLEEATQKLVMVHAGSTKELKSLGIAVTEGATVMQNLDSITKQVTGTSSAYMKTTAGQTDQLKVTMEGLQESIGQALAPALNSLLQTITPVLTKIVDWIERNPELVKWILIIAGAITGFIAVLTGLAAVIAVVTAVSSPWLLIIGAIILAIGAVIAITVLLVKNWDNIRAYFKTLWSDIVATFETAIAKITGFFDGLLNTISNVINNVGKVASVIGGVVSAPINFATNLVSGKKALGGNVSGGSTYLVGENGPELFTASQTGNIQPNGRGSGGATIIIDMSRSTFLSRDVATQIGDMIIGKLKTQVRLGM